MGTFQDGVGYGGGEGGDGVRWRGRGGGAYTTLSFDSFTFR